MRGAAVEGGRRPAARRRSGCADDVARAGSKKTTTKDMFKFYNRIVGLTSNPTPLRLFLADKIKISQARDQDLCHLEKVIFRVLFSIDYTAPNQKTTICVPLDLKIKLPEAK